MKTLDEWVGRVSKLFAFLAAFCTLIMMVTMLADVINRTLLGEGSLPGAYELSAMLLVMIVFLGFAYAERTETNIRVNLVTSRMSFGAARVARLVSGLVSAAVVVLFSWTAWDRAITSVTRGEISQGIILVPIWPAKIVLAIGFTLLTLECILGVWRRWRPPLEAPPAQNSLEGASL